MLHFEYQGAQFRVRWHYGIPNKGRDRRTTCLIEKQLPDGEWDEIRRGVVTHYSKTDPYNKSKGRENAMRKAVTLNKEDFEERQKIRDGEIFNVERPFRLALYEAYLKECVPSWNPNHDPAEFRHFVECLDKAVITAEHDHE